VIGKTKKMVQEANYLSFTITASELEALLLEARMVRKLNTRYNTLLKDDKHPLYIKITKEAYPRVLTARKIEEKGNIAFFGPFPSSIHVKRVLKMLRKIFPYADHKPTKKTCLNYQIGLCNPCPSFIENQADKDIAEALRRSYLKNIKMINHILQGRVGTVKKDLAKEIDKLSKGELFEEALEVRNKLDSLNYITQPRQEIESFMDNPNFIEDVRQKELGSLKRILNQFIPVKSLKRIECFDVAHFSGKQTTSSMVVFIDGNEDKSLYKHFRIRQEAKGDDTKSLEEVVTRRLKHLQDWGTPDLVVVDGGKPQVGVFYRIFSQHNIHTIGIAKRHETLVIPKKVEGQLRFESIVLPRSEAKNLIQRLRNEAHRFAQRYHHLLFKKELIQDFD
jgi:excinuclease ABC subunit C